MKIRNVDRTTGNGPKGGEYPIAVRTIRVYNPSQRTKGILLVSVGSLEHNDATANDQSENRPRAVAGPAAAQPEPAPAAEAESAALALGFPSPLQPTEPR